MEMDKYNKNMEVTYNQLRDAIQKSMRNAGCEFEIVTNEYRVIDYLYFPSVPELIAATRDLRNALRMLGIDNLGDIEFEKRERNGLSCCSRELTLAAVTAKAWEVTTSAPRASASEV